MKTNLLSLTVLPAFVLATACAAPAEFSSDTGELESPLIGGRAGAVFTLTNEPISNDVLVYRRASDGSLQYAARYGTTGRGSGDGLGSQGALVLGGDGRYLFAVSAGSDELSVFRVRGETLHLVDTIATGGVRPVSVTEHAGLVYVVHAGDGANDIRGFRQQADGTLVAVAGSKRTLSGSTVAPAQVQFSPSGRALLVTEKATNKIDEFRIDSYTGCATSHVVHASNGDTPFGFAVTGRGQVIVSEAFGGAEDASAVSSYQLGAWRGLSSVSDSVPNTEGAACWVVLAKADTVAFVSNTASGLISAYRVAASGAVTLVDSDGRAADTGAGSKPTDMATSRDGRFLYVVESGTHTVGVVRVESTGDLTTLADVPGLPANAAGLAAQ